MANSKLLILQLVFLAVTYCSSLPFRPEDIDIFPDGNRDFKNHNRVPKDVNSDPDLFDQEGNSLNDQDSEIPEDSDIEGGRDENKISEDFDSDDENKEGADLEPENKEGPSHSEDNPNSSNKSDQNEDAGAESHDEPGDEGEVGVPHEDAPREGDVPHEDVPREEDVPHEDVPHEGDVPHEEDAPPEGDVPDKKGGQGVDDDLSDKNPNQRFGVLLGFNPILGLKLMNEYFLKLEKAMEQVFQRSLADALGNVDAFTNTTDEVVEVNGQKYNVHKTLIKSGDKDSSVVIQSFVSEPISNNTKVEN